MDYYERQEQAEKEIEQLEKRGEIIYQEEVTDDRWEKLLEKCKQDPQHYIEMEGAIQIVPEEADFTSATNKE